MDVLEYLLLLQRNNSKLKNWDLFVKLPDIMVYDPTTGIAESQCSDGAQSIFCSEKISGFERAEFFYHETDTSKLALIEMTIWYRPRNDTYANNVLDNLDEELLLLTPSTEDGTDLYGLTLIEYSLWGKSRLRMRLTTKTDAKSDTLEGTGRRFIFDTLPIIEIRINRLDVNTTDRKLSLRITYLPFAIFERAKPMQFVS